MIKSAVANSNMLIRYILGMVNLAHLKAIERLAGTSPPEGIINHCWE